MDYSDYCFFMFWMVCPCLFPNSIPPFYFASLGTGMVPWCLVRAQHTIWAICWCWKVDNCDYCDYCQDYSDYSFDYSYYCFWIIQIIVLDYWIIAIIVVALLRANSKFASINPELKRAFSAQNSLGKMIQCVFHCFSGLQPKFRCHIFAQTTKPDDGLWILPPRNAFSSFSADFTWFIF